MESVYHFGKPKEIERLIDSHILYKLKDKVSIGASRENFYFNGVVEDKSEKQYLQFGFEGGARYGPLKIDANANLISDGCFQIQFNLPNYKFNARISSEDIAPSFKIPKASISNSFLSTGGHFISKYFSTSVAAGILFDKSVASLVSFETDKIGVSIKGRVNVESVEIEAATLLKNGIFASAGCDVANFSNYKLISGALYQSPKKSGFILYNFREGKMQSGLFIENDKATVGTKLSYCPGKHHACLEAGFIAKRAATFTGSVTTKGTIRSQAKFSPRPWLDISLRSKSNMKTNLRPIEFGWSLAFNL